MNRRKRQRCLSYQRLESRNLLATLFAEGFESFSGLGFSTPGGAGQLDSNHWRATGLSDGDGSFLGTHTTGDFARGFQSAPVSTGGVYAFDVGANRVLGAQPTGSDITPGAITLRFPAKMDISRNEYGVSNAERTKDCSPQPSY